MIDDYTAIILAGGKSSRMGENKALMKINGKTVIEQLIFNLDKVFKQIIIVTNSPKEMEKFGKYIISDIFPHLGPIAGIHSGLLNSKTENNFIVSCDMPLLSINTIKYLLKYNFSCDAVFYQHQSNIQMLCGLYKKGVYKIAQNLIMATNIDGIKDNQKIKLRLLDLLNNIDFETIDTNQLKSCNPNEFLNMNTRSDFEKIKQIIFSAHL